MRWAQLIDSVVRCVPKRWRRPLRYCIVGGIATGIHYGAYLLLLLWLPAEVAYTMGYVCSFVVNYWLTNRFTFRTHPNVRNGVGFALSHFVNYTLHILLLELFIRLGIVETIAPIVVYMVVIPVNYFLLRFFFRTQK